MCVLPGPINAIHLLMIADELKVRCDIHIFWSICMLLRRQEKLLELLIYFDVGQVDDMTADFIISQLLLLDAEDPTKDIKLFINSPGGSVTAGT